MGLLPLALALGLAAVLARLLTLGVPPGEDRARLALVAGAVLAFVTVAIPLQFEREWLTLGWALLGASLAWLFGRIPHGGLVWWSGGLFAAAFLRLAMNPAVLTYHAPRRGADSQLVPRRLRRRGSRVLSRRAAPPRTGDDRRAARSRTSSRRAASPFSSCS